MASFFARMRSSAGGSSPSNSNSWAKKDPNAQQQTPLEKLLLDAGPLRNDGSDKFFGMENFGNTCYCNSILQCLYYTAPFREYIMNYPQRSPPDSFDTLFNFTPRPNGNIAQSPNGHIPVPSTKPKPTAVNSFARNPGGPIPPPKLEDKDAPEYKKKQAMMRGPVLNLNQSNSTSYGMPESLFTALKDIFEVISANSSRIGVISPTKFLEVLRRENEMFRSLMHQDAHEFLNLLLNEVIGNVEVHTKNLEEGKETDGSAKFTHLNNGFVNAMSKVSYDPQIASGKSVVHDLFEGTLTSETKCLTCENVSQRDEPFLDLSVDLEHHFSVTSCLRKFSEEEMLCERNKFHCDRCGGLQEAEKRMKIKRLPRILALHLKRFKYMEDSQRLQKLFHRIVYPYHLRLFNTTDDVEDPDRLYELYAVVVHIGGGPYHGHYVSIIKTQDRGWLLFDDEMVEPVDKIFVRNFFGDRPGLACAYVLFYQETTLEAVRREQDADWPPVAVSVAVTPKETTGLGLKTSGIFANHDILPKSPISPTLGDDNKCNGLDKAATEPSVMASHLQPSLGNDLVLNPTTLLKPPLVLSKEEPRQESETLREARDQKLPDRDQEKPDRSKFFSLDFRKRENEKKHTTDVKGGLEAKIAFHPLEEEAPPMETNYKHIPNGTAGAFSRFRSTSKSISKRPKLWLSRDSSKEESAIDGEENSSSTNQTLDKSEKFKHRFSSLRKKKSNLLS